MDDPDNGQHGDGRSQQKASEIGRSTTQQKEADRQLTASDLHYNSMQGVDNTDSKRQNFYRETSKSPPNNSFLTSNAGQENSPIAPSEKSWPALDTHTPQLFNKRNGSPLNTDTRPIKRQQTDPSPAAMRPSTPLAPGILVKDQSAPQEVCLPPNHHTPTGFGTSYQPQVHSLSGNRFDGHPRYHPLTHPSPSHHSISTRSSSHSTNPKSRHQNTSPTVQILDMTSVQQAQVAALEAQPYQFEQGNPPFGSPHKAKKPRPPQLDSPIWNEGYQMAPQQQRADRDHAAFQTPQRNNHMSLAGRKTPFYDGGIPGDGGESSDEEIMLAPQVEGRDVYMGGYRNHGPSPSGPHEFGTRFQPLKQAFMMEDMWKGTELVNRRKKKLLGRSLAAEWREARDKGDPQKMDKIKRKADTAKVGPPRLHLHRQMGRPEDESSAPDSTRYGAPAPHGQNIQPQSQRASSRAQIEGAEHSPRGLLCYYEQDSRSCRQSRPLRAFAAENLRSQSQSGNARTSRSKDARNRIRLPSAGKSPREPGTFGYGYGYEEDADDEDESLPMLGYIRNTRPNMRTINSQGTPYQAANILPKESIAYNQRSKATHPTNGLSRPHGFAYAGGAIVSNSGGFQTPQPKVRPRAPAPQNPVAELPDVINLCSSTENTPVSKRSVPMKDRIATSQKKATSKPTKIRSEISRRPDKVKEEPDPEVARQQMYANRIIAAEINITNEQLFGEVIGGTPEEKAHWETAKLTEAQRKRDVIMKEKLLKEEEARLAEAQKQKELEETREKERLRKEREEQSKKAKREVERKKQQALEESLREEKRRKAAELIKAARAKEAADVEEQEKKRQNEHSDKINQLQLEIFKKDLELKKLQVSTLIAAKFGTPDRSKSSGPKATPTPPSLADDEDSLFISEAQSNHGAGSPDHAFIYDIDERARLRAKCPPNVIGVFAGVESKPSFREQVAQDRVSRDDRRKTEAIQRRLETRTSSAPLNSSPNTTEPVKEKQKKSRSAPKNRSTFSDLQSALGTLSQPPFIGNLIQPEPIKSQPSKPPSERSTLATIAQIPFPPPPNKVYPSEVRYLEVVDRERVDAEQKARKEERKRKKNEERRRNDSEKIANKHRQKLINEAAEGGYTRTEEVLNILVDNYMKQREARYAKTQAKKAGKSAGSSSFDSYLTAQPQPQSLYQKRSFTPQQTSSQPQIQQQSSSFSSASSETERENEPDTEVIQAQKTTRNELNKQLAAAKRDRGGRFAKAAAKTRVSHFDSNSDESEEDPDESLEAMLAAKRGKKASANESDGGNQTGELDLSDNGTQLEDDLNNAFEDLSDSNQSNLPTSPTITKFSKSKVANTHSQNSNQPKDEMIRIYNVEKIETKSGEEGDVEHMKMFTDRQDANDEGEELILEYRKNASVKPHHVTERYTEDEFYTGTVVFNMSNSVTVRVTSKIETSAKFAGLDVSKMKKFHGENVWAIKRILKKSITDPGSNHTVVTHIKEDATDEVYTDREYANCQAAQSFIAFLKPKGPNIDQITEWTGWQDLIRAKAKEADMARVCLEVGVTREDGELAWLEWGEVDYHVEIKKTAGPKN